MTGFVSLFRGINVGGQRMVKMDELKALHETLGLRDVVTYIQSGNVVFRSDETDSARLAQRIEDAFAGRFGFRSDVILRSEAGLQEAIANNPFQHQPEKEGKWVLILFLASRLEPAALQNLHGAYTGPEESHLFGQELYIYYPSGMGRSKLTLPLIEKKLKTTGTGRNWNTVLQLQKLLQR
ncbi:MAG TPA: DUF1697 domain-containing protein [Ktedonobacteraceae bacterium]|nr:DUF1697 domain-containing protein [Ktedonobacteraceae bacterium]